MTAPSRATLEQSPSAKERLRPLIPHSYSTPRVEKWSESAPNPLQQHLLEALPLQCKMRVPA